METTDEIVFSAGTFLFACGNEEVAKLVYLAGEQVVKADTLPGLPDGGSPPILVGEEFLFPNHPLLPPALATVERSERVFFPFLYSVPGGRNFSHPSLLLVAEILSRGRFYISKGRSTSSPFRCSALFFAWRRP